MIKTRDYREPPSGDGGGLAFDDAGDDAVELREWTASAESHAQRLDRVLADAVPAFSRSHLQGLVERGHVRIDGTVCTHSARRLRAGQRIVLELVPTAEALAFRPQAMALPIVHEDDHLLVLDKPAGLVVHPGAGHWSGTLLNGLLAHHAAAAQLPRAGIVHRLDKGTSGLMVVGKSLPAVTGLVRAIAAREVRREYLALVHGRLGSSIRSFDAPIGRDPQVRTRMAALPSGKPARTDAECLLATGEVSAVRCRLHTGRTHQIRVHLSHAGHPLVGDPLYGGRCVLGMDRPALHAWRLGFVHPVAGGEPLLFTSALPDDLAAAWQALGATPG